MSHAQFVEPLHNYIVDNHLDGKAHLDSQTPLLEWGIIDSLALGEVLGFIEEKFGIDVPSEEVTPDNFESLTTLSALLGRLEDGN